MTYTEPAYAKLNLTLDILGKRPDGYHDLRMVMTSVDLQDVLTVTISESGGLHLTTNLHFLPQNDTNLAARAANSFFKETGLSMPGLNIDIKKAIPVCAGMAGGSSDGAAMLRILRRSYTPEMPMEELCAIGARVGSDVPYCVVGGTALVEGRGEHIKPVAPMPDCYFVICKPPFPISTPELFAQVRLKRLRCHPDTAGMLAALEQGDLEGVAHRLYNVFEEVLPRKYALVFELKNQLLENGAMAASMTGSGPSVFGIFDQEKTACGAVEAMKSVCPTIFLCRPVRSTENGAHKIQKKRV